MNKTGLDLWVGIFVVVGVGALLFLALVAWNSTKSSTSATCGGESVLIFDIKLCSTVAFIVILLGGVQRASA